MNLILCLDNRNGFAINGRRLSRDIAVSKRCMEMTNSAKLCMNGYTSKLFDGAAVTVSENFWQLAGEEDFCFAEVQLPELTKVNRIYVFRWNRNYPADVTFDPGKAGFMKISEEDFAGNSHPVITMEVYKR